LGQFSKNYRFFTQKVVTKVSKIWVWDPGFGIRDLGSEIWDPEKNLFRIPDPGSRGQKGTGSRIRIRNTAFRPSRAPAGQCCHEGRKAWWLRSPGEVHSGLDTAGTSHRPEPATGASHQDNPRQMSQAIAPPVLGLGVEAMQGMTSAMNAIANQVVRMSEVHAEHRMAVLLWDVERVPGLQEEVPVISG
jgi:hypothetical protein